MRITSANIVLFGIVLFSFILRSYKIEDNFIFTGEFGQNLLDIKNFVESSTLPLIGPATSHPWLSFGPLYYWLGLLVMNVFGGNPLNFAWLGVFVGTLVPLLNYFVVKQIFGQKTALISSTLIAISPVYIYFSIGARFYSFVLLLFYPYLWCLHKIWNKDFGFMFWLGVVYGAMFSFHYSPLIFLPVIILVFWRVREELNLRNYLNFSLGLIISNLPFLVYDSQSGFTMTRNLVLWIPYRFIKFAGQDPKNILILLLLGVLTYKVLLAHARSIFSAQLHSKSGSSGFKKLSSTSLRSWFSAFADKALTIMARRRINFSGFFVGSTIFFGLIILFIHGTPPLHYFLPILPLIPIVLAKLIETRMIFVILTVPYLLIFKLPTDFVSYKKQIEISKFIIERANGAPFVLGRIGPYDYFEKDYAQNYQYLMWLYGNEPKDQGNRSFTIVEKSFNNIEVLEER